MDLSENALLEFFSECDEILQRFSSTLTQVEKTGQSNSETMSSLYRDMHTLKGSSQLFGFQLIAQVSHAMEASLEPMRRLKIKIPLKLIDIFFKSIDLIERILKDSSDPKNGVKGIFDEEVKGVVSILISTSYEYFGGDLLIVREKYNSFDDQVKLDQKRNQEEKKSVEIKEKNKIDHHEKTADINIHHHQSSLPINNDMTTKEKNKDSKDAHDISDTNTTVRIHVGLLDKLMNLVGEMVLVRNQMLQYSEKHDNLEFLNLNQRLNLVTSELQGEVMKTRMQPVGSILSKFQRLTRDLSKELGKQIEWSVQGAETEVDKTLLEAIKDPLTHLVRNACDHGLETPEERLQARKSPMGHIKVKAFHEGGHIIIEISDDGRGLHLQKIAEKAVEKKIVTQEQISKMSDREIGLLIFSPGFSTAKSVTSVSGRGVGMDVVKTNLEQIGGQVELQSEQGKGMTVRLRIPLTLAIVPALIIKSGGEQFSIPQVKLSELVRVENSGDEQKIEMLQGKPVYRLRGQLLPLINLSEILLIKDLSQSQDKESVNIVVLNGDVDGDIFGLVVDGIRDTADIVVKPLTSFLKKLQIYSGATIMGDGSVSLILDVSGLAQKENLFHKANARSFTNDSQIHEKKRDMNEEKQDFLFFKIRDEESHCLPICLVYRIEEFQRSEIQYSGNQRIVKYRGSILHLISLSDYYHFTNPSTTNQENSKISLIVVKRKEKLYGLEVCKIVDIISIMASIQESVKEIPGVLGCIIVEQDVTTVIDVFAIIDQISGTVERTKDQDKTKQKSLDKSQHKNIHILLAEDTIFFMKQVKKLLENNGYKVTHAPDGQIAWDMLSSSSPEEYQLLLTDIEMPKMTGFELAEKVRGDNRFNKTPMVALTTKFRDVDLEKGRQVGFNRYLEKLRSDELLETISEILEGNVHV